MSCAGSFLAAFHAPLWAEGRFTDGEIKVQVAEMPARDNGLRRGRIGKRGLGDDRWLNLWQ